MKFKKLLIFVAGVAMLLMACGIPGLEDGYLSFDFEVDENQFQELMQNGSFTINNENVFDLVTDVDFRDGIVHIEGTRDGVDGYVDVSFTSEDNKIKVEIVDHNVNDIDADIDQLNETLAESLAGATDQAGDIEFTDIEVTDDAIVMAIRVKVIQE